MVICKIWDAEYPWDVRVEKVSRTLQAHGHEVHIVARNRNGRPVEERLDEAVVHRLAPLPGLGTRLNAASMFPAFFNPRWVRLVSRTVRAQRANLILCRDLPLAPTAVWVGRRAGIPVVLDMAENYPAMIMALWETKRQRPADRLVRNVKAVELVERWVVQRVDHIIVVVEESRDRLIELGIAPERVTVVSNTPSVARLDVDEPRAVRANGTLHLAYLGNLGVPRGIGPLLEAVAECRKRACPVMLDIYGDGRDRSLFESQARTLELGTEAVKFHGSVPYARGLQAIREADVGVVPHFVNDFMDTTISNKLFDYMAAGIPVLTSDTKPTARVVRETRCGEVYRDRDVPDLVQAILRLRDPAYREACGSTGRQAVAERYNWEVDGGRLASVVERLGPRS